MRTNAQNTWALVLDPKLDHGIGSSFGDMGARVRTGEFAETTCCLGLDADPMSHQVSHDRVDSKEHLYRIA